MMLQSHYDPVQKRIVFGPAPDGSTAAPLPMPAGAPAPNVIPQPQASNDPVEANAAAGYQSPNAPESSGQVPGRLGGAPPLPGGQPSLGRSMALPTPAAGAPAMSAGPGREMDVQLPMISVGPPQQAPAPAMPGGPSSGGGMMRQPLGAYYQQLEGERGLPDGFLARTRAIESSNGTRLANPNSSARGDFQFIRSTAKQFGIDPMDPYQSARAAADMAAQNMKTMRAKGIEPDGADLYAAHQQGIGGYLQLRSGQRTSDAAMGLNGGAGLSGSQMLAKWRTAYGNAKPGNLGEGFTPNYQPAGGNQGQGPTVANAAKLPGGDQGGGTTASGVPAVASNTYKGGILGLMGVGDQSAPGMNKDFGGKMQDMLAQPGGGAIGGLVQGIAGMLGGGRSTAQPAQFGPAPEDHKADASLMALLDRKRRGKGVV